jgi:hypothetical protein
MAEADFPRSYIVGFGSSPSRCGPAWPQPPGRTRDLPASDGLLLRVMRSSTPARRRRLAWRRAHVAFAASNQLGPRGVPNIEAQCRTPRNCCVRSAGDVAAADATLATRRTPPLTWAGLPPAGHRQLRLAHWTAGSSQLARLGDRTGRVSISSCRPLPLRSCADIRNGPIPRCNFTAFSALVRGTAGDVAPPAGGS